MKKLLFLAVAIFSIVSLSSCGDTSAKNTNTGGASQTSQTIGVVTHVDASTFKDLLSKNTGELIDVRTPRENQAGAIEGTNLNIDVTGPNFKAEIDKLDKDKTYMVYCRSGGRSGKAVKIMESMGFKHLYNLKGGYRGWKKAGN